MKNWIRPCTEVQKFEANVCATTCGIVNGQYVFTCDAPAGNVHIKYKGTDYTLGGYTPCTATHKTDGTGEYFDGWVDYNRNGRQDSGEPNQLIWVEGFSALTIPVINYVIDVSADNWHASASLSREQSTVERS